MDTLLDMLMFLAVALHGYLTGQGFPPGERIRRWGGRFPMAVVRPSGPWRWWSRLLSVVGALATTAPVWPIIQPGDPFADETLEPAEVADRPCGPCVPAAWALLGWCRPYAGRAAGVLAACAGWSLWTSTFGSYGTRPNVDDGLRWHLVGTGVIVASATVIEASRRGLRQQLSKRRAAGVLVWIVGVAAIFAISVVGDEQLPPRDAILPLPPAMTVAHEEAGCATPKQFPPRTCWRRLTVAATDNAPVQDLTRGLGQHLERTKGWRVTWYGFDSDPHIECRPAAWMANPYRLCADVRSGKQPSTVDMRFVLANPHDPIYD
ncbi:hypothetical protein AB0J74_21120 [Asanoa sp. NPDC049573]|uniref:hypothetical protein n=1 Tax=Asanoa sp. NPDC049573 TaxID=3155396 RepID=UPI0034400664